MALLCPPGVYRAQDDTALLASVLRDSGYAADAHVLDLGTGSGALAVAASRAGAASVTAVDVSLRSVLTTWLNSGLGGARVRVRRGDLFAPVRGQRFDLIVANPPYVPAPTARLPRYAIGRCWDGGLDGRSVLDRICAGVVGALRSGGRLLLVHSALCGVEQTVERLAAEGMSAEVVARARIPFGPVLRTRATLLESKGLIEAGETTEELVVIGARRGV